MKPLLLLLALCPPLIAQPAAQSAASEVASIKLNKSGDPSNSNFPLGPGDAHTQDGGRFPATGIPLSGYLGFAYKLTSNQAQALLDQLPLRVREERYDIEARAAGNPTKDQMRMLMRALLAERCKLALHERRNLIQPRRPNL